MNKDIEKLIHDLKALKQRQDDDNDPMYEEDAHRAADKLLLAYINDDEVSAAFHKIGKWYS
jgi:hypothetical protein